MTIITAGAIAAVYENEITVMLWSPGEASIAIPAFDSILNTINTKSQWTQSQKQPREVFAYCKRFANDTALSATELHGQNWTGTLCAVPWVGPNITIRQHQHSPYEVELYSALSSETREKLLSEKQAERYLLFTERKHKIILYFRFISCFLVDNVNTMVYKYVPRYISNTININNAVSLNVLFITESWIYFRVSTKY